jgi:transposase
MDRDENAALNIVNAGPRFSPKGAVGEAVKGDPERIKVIPGADAVQLTLQPKR